MKLMKELTNREACMASWGLGKRSGKEEKQEKPQSEYAPERDKWYIPIEELRAIAESYPFGDVPESAKTKTPQLVRPFYVKRLRTKMPSKERRAELEALDQGTQAWKDARNEQPGSWGSSSLSTLCDWDKYRTCRDDWKKEAGFFREAERSAEECICFDMGHYWEPVPRDILYAPLTKRTVKQSGININPRLAGNHTSLDGTTFDQGKVLLNVYTVDDGWKNLTEIKNRRYGCYYNRKDGVCPHSIPPAHAIQTENQLDSVGGECKRNDYSNHHHANSSAPMHIYNWEEEKQAVLGDGRNIQPPRNGKSYDEEELKAIAGMTGAVPSQRVLAEKQVLHQGKLRTVSTSALMMGHMMTSGIYYNRQFGTKLIEKILEQKRSVEKCNIEMPEVQANLAKWIADHPDDMDPEGEEKSVFYKGCMSMGAFLTHHKYGPPAAQHPEFPPVTWLPLRQIFVYLHVHPELHHGFQPQSKWYYPNPVETACIPEHLRRPSYQTFFQSVTVKLTPERKAEIPDYFFPSFMSKEERDSVQYETLVVEAFVNHPPMTMTLKQLYERTGG
jgi:hypothetical protein